MSTAKIIFGCLILTSSLMLFSCNRGVKDIDSNHYRTIMIGNQVWMEENLNVSRFRNGDSIPEVKSSEEWIRYGEERKPACCTFQNEPENGKKYGKLYNWYAVSDPRGLAPKGWHVSSDDEWTQLIDYLGGGMLAALKMRTSGLLDIGNKSSQSGFSGLPGGARAVDGNFGGIASYGYWWSSTEALTSQAWIRILSYDPCDINFFSCSKNCGISVRCVRD